MGIVQDKVVIVTGAARGVGRAHALEFARQGARVVVNDLGCEVDGSGAASGPAGEVVEEIRAGGGEAIANGDDVSSWDGAGNLVNSAIETFGRLDVLVSNAGILRDRMLTNMTEDDWDQVMRVHLKGTFAPARRAAAWWRERFKETGEPVGGRIINTTSGAGLFGNAGQTNYAAAKAGIVGFTIVAAMELGRYGVTVNAIGPGARSRMTEHLIPMLAERGTVDKNLTSSIGEPEHVSPLVVWLASDEAAGISGQVFQAMGGRVQRLQGWRVLEEVRSDDIWEPAALGKEILRMYQDVPARPLGLMGASESG